MRLMQFRTARAAYGVPWAHAAALAPRPPRRPILILSIARCGSTLLSRLLAQCPGIRSYSEPQTHAQLALLRAWGCDAIQGFHLSKPVPADEFVALLHTPAPARACA